MLFAIMGENCKYGFCYLQFIGLYKPRFNGVYTLFYKPLFV